MAFLRFTRDRRGYENTFLLHAARPGERPIVLYWYRSAPGVRVGRPALDEEAIRTIEEQHPDVDFDWPQILEVGAVTEPEVERRPVRQKRHPSQAGAARPDSRARPRADAAPEPETEPEPDAVVHDTGDTDRPPSAPDDTPAHVSDERSGAYTPRPHDLLDELVGHEIATRLHARYAEILGRVHRLPADSPERGALQARVEALNPDNWVTPDEVLRGVQHADALFDALRRELLAH